MKSFIKKILTFKLAVISRLILWRYKPFIIAITGSVGKTSAKDALFLVLQGAGYSVRKSDKSYNSEIGLPLTILGAQNPWNNIVGWMQVLWQGLLLFVIRDEKFPKYLVIETGVGKAGDMKHLTSIIKSNISVLTNLPTTPVHVEFFASREALWKEKVSLLVGTKASGVCIANAEDKQAQDFIIAQMGARAQDIVWYNDGVATHVNRVTYTFVKKDQALPCVHAVFSVAATDYEATFPSIVAPYALDAFLPALCVAEYLSIDIKKTIQILASYVPPPGRMRVFNGIQQSILIDDTYNASPIATQKALDTLFEVGAGKRKVAILSDMLELGDYTQQAHQHVGEYAVQKADVLVFVGLRSRASYDSALQYVKTHDLKQKHIEYVAHPEDIIFTFAKNVQPNDCILIKGSQGMRMERLVKELLQDKNDIQYLARQDQEWLKR